MLHDVSIQFSMNLGRNQYEFEVRRKVLFSSYGSAIFKNPLQQDGTEYSRIGEIAYKQCSSKKRTCEQTYIDLRPSSIYFRLLCNRTSFIAICWPSNGCTKVVDIASSNLALKRNRIYHLRRLINLSKIIETLQEVIGTREMPEYVPILRGVKIITLHRF
ncbi:unnamed protein product [Rhizophagus irregularis]|uniref:Uncharacterized protein n=1 Tax=Rhizophagus irregularis TaxID=588596 RepID=A0A916A284_9GLOM|nr:unnamed protein product [Rhizophagus irregularis]